jgi:hypothetical protein
MTRNRRSGRHDEDEGEFILYKIEIQGKESMNLFVFLNSNSGRQA